MDYCTSSYLQEGASKDSVLLETDEYLRDALQSVLQDVEVIGMAISKRTDDLASEVGTLEQAVRAVSQRLELGRRWAASENLSGLTLPVVEPPPLAKVWSYLLCYGIIIYFIPMLTFSLLYVKVATVAGDGRPINCRPLAPYKRIALKERLKDVYYKKEAPPPIDYVDDVGYAGQSAHQPSLSALPKNGPTVPSTGSNLVAPLATELPSQPSSRMRNNNDVDKSNSDLGKERIEERSREQAARLSVPRPTSVSGTGQVPFRPRVKNAVSSTMTRSSIGSTRERPAQKPPTLLSKRSSLGAPPPKISAGSRPTESKASPPPTPPKPRTLQASPPFPPSPPIPASSEAGDDPSDDLVSPRPTTPPPPPPPNPDE